MRPRHFRFAPALLAIAIAIGFTPAMPVRAAGAAVKIASLEDIQQEFTSVPCDDKLRLAAVRALFEKAGAPASALTTEAYGNVENLVLVKPGASSEKIVIGAHYDKVADGCGAIDNWTGQVVLTQLYRTLRDLPLQKTLVFVAFGREENGLVGARAMTRAIPDDQLAQYCAMVNIDSLGLGPPQVADNMSSATLTQLAAAQATQLEIPFAHARIRGADADSSAFVARQIPAVTLHGLNNSWSRILHSHRDQPAKVNAASVYLGYRLALSMLLRIDQSACASYRQAQSS